MAFAKETEVHAGTKLVCDAGFTCMQDGEVKTVLADDGGLFIPCAEGQHYLDGQLDDGNEYIGLTLAPSEV